MRFSARGIAALADIRTEFTRFFVVGAANFLLTFVIFTGMMKGVGAHYAVALVTAWLVGVVFSYVLNFLWVFRPEDALQFRARFFRFAFANLISVGLNVILLSIAVEALHFDAFLSQLALIPLIVVMNFSSAKFWSMRPTRRNASG